MPSADLLSVRLRYREAYFGLKLWRAYTDGQPWALHDLEGLPPRDNGIHDNYAQVGCLCVPMSRHFSLHRDAVQPESMA